MIVCSCNVFTDRDVRATMTTGQDVPRTTGQVYHCLGCSAQCGRCARTIRRIMDEALKHDPEKWQPVFGRDHARKTG
jgi:bacterioferritin-associated ferredoxin